jgi:hypothetical protein
MGCQPCEERRARLLDAAQGGPALPARDWAFYAGWGLAVALGAVALWSHRGARK